MYSSNSNQIELQFACYYFVINTQQSTYIYYKCCLTPSPWRESWPVTIGGSATILRGKIEKEREYKCVLSSLDVINMVMYEIHRHPSLQKYRTHICSRATLFQFFVVVLTFIPPLIIAYVTHGKLGLGLSGISAATFLVVLYSLTVPSTGFWLKENTYREQPDVKFKHEFVLIAQGNTPTSFLAYSTFQNFNQLLQQNLRIPLIQVIEE